MYKEFFNFSAEPFRITPDPGFLFLTDQHREALAAIIYGIAKRKGFVSITGEVGVGKTTILRSYLDSVDEAGLIFVNVYNPNVSFLTLLRHIFKELGITYAGDEIAAAVETLRAWLVARHQRRETLVLLIDEAQNMPIGTLESLRMLSNIETNTEKLVQIVLVGQPELETLLGERQLRQLESRIAVRTRLGPLSQAESMAYIRHRLRCVALDDRPSFTDGALKLIARRAGGIPRRINVLCDNVLMTAFGHKARPATGAIVREVLTDLRLKNGRMRGSGVIDLPAAVPWRRIALAAGGAAALGAVAVAAILLVPQLPPIQPVAGPESLAIAMPPPPPVKPLEVIPAEPQPVPVADAPASLPPLPPAIEVGLAPTAALPEAVAAPSLPMARPTVRIVAPGDTLADLTLQVYGAYDGRILDRVKAHNPEIVDVDRIQIGQIIEFPAWPGKME